MRPARPGASRLARAIAAGRFIPFNARRGEFSFEIRKGAEGRLDGIGQRTSRLAASAMLHDFPKHRVIPVAAAVVPHGGADIFGNAVETL